ncbi:MAG: peptidoglycan bridge formation glycyltransferase FemA/FemB family protein [Elusimicrobia bacterium]|nr:peptidoglycan bridge formation glycyltransferase FemA/FemB family protein [Elusimicrobiota bacterium]
MGEPLTLAAEAWDRTTATAVKHHVFQTAGWSEVKAPSGWRAHRLCVERDGVFRVGLQVLERDFPKIRYRFFYAPRGPVLSEGWTAEDLAELFRRVEKLARERKAVFLKIDPDVSKTMDWISGPLLQNGFRRAPETGGFSGVQPRLVFRLDISKSEEDLLKGMDQKTRYNIRLAEKKGVTIRPVASREEIETFYRILVDTARRDGFLIRPAGYFLDIQKRLGAQGKAQFFLAEREGKPISGALALTHGKTTWYAYGASANTDRQYMPNHLMQWTMIRWAKSNACTLYDFRAVPSNPKPEDPLYGLYRFKKGFGAELTEFVGEYDRVYVPWLYFLWVHGWPIFKKIRRAILLRPSRSTRPEAD